MHCLHQHHIYLLMDIKRRIGYKHEQIAVIRKIIPGKSRMAPYQLLEEVAFIVYRIHRILFIFDSLKLLPYMYNIIEP